MNRVPATPETIDRAASILREGGVVAFPTETVYGLGAHAMDAQAVARIFEIKARPTFDPLIVHVDGDTLLERVAIDVSALARTLMKAFWPGPLTLVLRKQSAVPELVTSGLPTVAVRMPAHPVARELLRVVGIPLAAPSANPFGYLSPTRAEHVERMLGDRVDLILDAGSTEFGVESTIVLLEPEPTLLRYGALPVEEIEAITGPLARVLTMETTPLAPGRLSQHYAPRTRINIIGKAPPVADRADAALLAYREAIPGYRAARVLAPSGDLREAAAHLFEALHELDASGASRIDVEPVPRTGLGAAIMDRLDRAAAR
jgi:L-threonylcarbamoyladenylate synthase